MNLKIELEKKLQNSIADSSNEELYVALLQLIKDQGEKKVTEKGKKKLYYISAEFLIGKLLSNNLINLGIYEEVKQLLEKEGIHVRVVDMFTIKPLDEELVKKCAEETGAIVTAENHSVYGGLGSAVAEYLGENDPTIVERIGTRDEFGEVGSEEYLRGRFGFTPEKIAERVKEAIARKKA